MLDWLQSIQTYHRPLRLSHEALKVNKKGRSKGFMLANLEKKSDANAKDKSKMRNAEIAQQDLTMAKYAGDCILLVQHEILGERLQVVNHKNK
jgi:hypothetical protein